jgi:Lrp/AsnC family transcriptional regulator, leucine-responsive regulatory protein
MICEASMDDLDRQILELLVANSRTSLKDLGKATHLSSPSVADRIRRLEEKGVIRAFTIDIDPEALGYGLQAVVRVRPLPGMLHIVERLIQETPEFIDCEKVTGDDCFIAKLCFRSMSQLDAILDRISEKAETNTSIVKATPVRRRLPPLGK